MSLKSLPELVGYERIAGHAALDFVNTVGGSREAGPREYLKSYAHLIAWSVTAGLLNATEAGALARRADREPELASEVLSRAIALREAIYRVVTSAERGRRRNPEDLFLISREAAYALGRSRLTLHGN